MSSAELIAQNARTLWGNIHSCKKLFNMLNKLRRWHEWPKSQKTAPHTWGNSSDKFHGWRSAQLIALVCARLNREPLHCANFLRSNFNLKITKGTTKQILLGTSGLKWAISSEAAWGWKSRSLQEDQRKTRSGFEWNYRWLNNHNKTELPQTERY